MLFHAMYGWPEDITPALWPFANSLAPYNRNNFRIDTKGLTPVIQFSKKWNQWHGLKINMYLDAEEKLPRWDERARVGVYFGRSPVHADSIALVLNLNTGYVRP